MILQTIPHLIRYPRIIAHRCGGALAPENTLAGMRIAARLGCRGVEFDVALTADGVPILMHDATLERTTNGAGFLATKTAAEIACLDAGGKHHRAFAVEPAPTFQAALQTCAELGLWANVEIKPTPGTEAETGRVVANLVAGIGPGTVLLSSFSVLALQQALHVAPAIPRALLTETIPADWRDQLVAAGASALHTAASGITVDLIAPLCHSRIQLACYTVNDRATAATLFAAGVSAIFTDRLDLWMPEEM
ncbi:glycerophosphodiester phosphodiesterase [Rugosibacter aromaticivorans]|uniref:glycerophosphodiester phosphodiesterase n=1 Tax=Rugosibacter aromaticivorans TaxID=1565605 RepID=UPI000AFF3003|nr:glycerophosphodiester phosphodiesterase [Rugosibacter aromaticivorans]